MPELIKISTPNILVLGKQFEKVQDKNISDSIKMLAVEEIIQNSMPATIKLFTSDKKICNSFKDLASKLNIKLEKLIIYFSFFNSKQYLYISFLGTLVL